MVGPVQVIEETTLFGDSVVAETSPDIAGGGRRALPLTAVLEFLLAGSRALAGEGRAFTARDRERTRTVGRCV
jgi:hypothetical protein